MELLEKIEAYPFGSSTLEFRICSDVASKSNIRNQVGCEEVVEGAGVRIEAWD